MILDEGRWFLRRRRRLRSGLLVVDGVRRDVSELQVETVEGVAGRAATNNPLSSYSQLSKLTYVFECSHRCNLSVHQPRCASTFIQSDSDSPQQGKSRCSICPDGHPLPLRVS